jgi:prefoldin subunit 5
MSYGVPIQPIGDPEVRDAVKRIEAKLAEMEFSIGEMKSTLEEMKSTLSDIEDTIEGNP